MESALITTPFAARANSTASPDLPLAVGPAISTALTCAFPVIVSKVMSLVATLICNPASPALDTTLIEATRAILPGAGAAEWLFDGVAADIPFANPDDRGAVVKRLREALGDLPVDVVVQPEIGRRKRLFLADMDSTMIGQECIDELA